MMVLMTPPAFGHLPTSWGGTASGISESSLRPHGDGDGVHREIDLGARQGLRERAGQQVADPSNGGDVGAVGTIQRHLEGERPRRAARAEGREGKPGRQY